MSALSAMDKRLVHKTRVFAKENRLLSTWYVLCSFILLVLALSISLQDVWWPVRLLFAVLEGLLILRCFVLYHDFFHGAILRGSKLANMLFTGFGLFALTPKRVWQETHNYHHAHTTKIPTSHIGSYKTVTVGMWQKMTQREQYYYRLQRHPVTILLGFFTLFVYNMCIASFKRNPVKNWDSLLAVLLHIGLASALWLGSGFDTYFFGILLPFCIAGALGGYMFYAQHNFPDVDIQPVNEWRFVHAALASSSYMEMGGVMRWFFANIGFHHVHHLNSRIPFYRLPEAMNAIEALQHPRKTSLRWADVVACFQLKLWDPQQRRMVGLAQKSPP